MNTDLTISELLHAYQTCIQNKKTSKCALEFSQNLTQNIYDLFDELINYKYL